MKGWRQFISGSKAIYELCIIITTHLTWHIVWLLFVLLKMFVLSRHNCEYQQKVKKLTWKLVLAAVMIINELIFTQKHTLSISFVINIKLSYSRDFRRIALAQPCFYSLQMSWVNWKMHLQLLWVFFSLSNTWLCGSVEAKWQHWAHVGKFWLPYVYYDLPYEQEPEQWQYQRQLCGIFHWARCWRKRCSAHLCPRVRYIYINTVHITHGEFTFPIPQCTEPAAPKAPCL